MARKKDTHCKNKIPHPDSLRRYENCTYTEVLSNKKLSYSTPWVRAALAWCAKKQISAHCLPRDKTELLEYMSAVNWKVTDPELFRILSTKLLQWTYRHINNEKLSPALIETRENFDQKSKCDYKGVWADYTKHWIDVEFPFILGSTCCKPPQGTTKLSPRPTVSRPWKSQNGLVEEAVQYLEHRAAQKDHYLADVSGVEFGVQYSSDEEDEARSPERPTRPIVTPKKPIKSAIPAIQSDSESTSEESVSESDNSTSEDETPETPTTTFTIPKYFLSAAADPDFLPWYSLDRSATITPTKKHHDFTSAANHPRFHHWYKDLLKSWRQDPDPPQLDTTTSLFTSVAEDPDFLPWYTSQNLSGAIPTVRQERDFHRAVDHPGFRMWYRSFVRGGVKGEKVVSRKEDVGGFSSGGKVVRFPVGSETVSEGRLLRSGSKKSKV